MKKVFKKLVAVACIATLTFASLTGCGSKSDETAATDKAVKTETAENVEEAVVKTLDSDKTVKIGVIVADASGEGALAFKAYYQDYIAKQYNVEFVYSEQLDDDASTKAQVETFIGQNCKAIIDMADHDRPGIAKLCDDNQVYYAVAAGMMAQEDYEACKTYEYFVGQIGADNETEYETGLAMGEYYKNTKGVSKVGLYGAFIPNPMHAYRLAGVLTGLGCTYDGKTGMDIATAAITDNGVVSTKIAGDVEVLYIAGWTDTLYDELGAILAQSPDAFLSVGMATTFFTEILNGSSMPFSDIDNFTAANGEAMNNGSLEYLAATHPSSIGPVFAAIMNAINGNPIRDEEGCAFSIGQSYWVATTYDEFAKIQTEDSVDSPIFDKEVLDTMAGLSYAEFEAAVAVDRMPK